MLCEPGCEIQLLLYTENDGCGNWVEGGFTVCVAPAFGGGLSVRQEARGRRVAVEEVLGAIVAVPLGGAALQGVA